MNKSDPPRRSRWRPFGLCMTILLTLSLLIALSIAIFVTKEEVAKRIDTRNTGESYADNGIQWAQKHQAANGEWQLEGIVSTDQDHVTGGMEWFLTYQTPNGEWTISSDE